ncbi:MAG TPA: RuBisCO large subunit C-terminal-like domain-containing protein [Methanomassiliicoccales archaeon]|nr:RuBisCO large subunit C-terminal-like domain-containing protein [Methanomassiliicoccales archaeon]
MEYSEKYLHLGERVDPDSHIFCTYKIRTELDMKQAAAAIATEQSTGTWTGVSTLTDKVFEAYGAKVVEIRGDQAVIAYPVADLSLDIGGVPQILSVIAGNLFGLDVLSGVRLEDCVYPHSVISKFKGPKFGVKGMRSILKRPTKPLVGTIVKPKIGLPPKGYGDYIYEAGKGGLTNGKDDETLVDQQFCPLEERVVAVAEALDRVKHESGHVMMHAINVSSRADRIVEVAERAQQLGASELMVDVLTSGFAAVQALAEDESIKVPIHVHRTMHGAFTRDKSHGIAWSVMAELVRMCGGDALHIGTYGVGKMHGDPKEDLASQHVCQDKLGRLKPVMCVASGGVHPALVHRLIEIGGKDIQIQAGGGVAGHPMGVRGGARAMVQAVDAAIEGIGPEKYAKGHEELRLALQKWG